MMDLQTPALPAGSDRALMARSENAGEQGTDPRLLRDISAIAAEIRSLKAQTMTNILQIGSMLIEAKEQFCRYGQWLDWLKHSVDLSMRMAERYMQLYRAYSNSTSVSDLTLTKALVLLAIPDAERDTFLKVPHEIKGARWDKPRKIFVREMTTTECRQAVRSWKESSSAKQSQVIKPFRSPTAKGLQCLEQEVTAIVRHLDSITALLKKHPSDSPVLGQGRRDVQNLLEKTRELLLLADSKTNQDSTGSPT